MTKTSVKVPTTLGGEGGAEIRKCESTECRILCHSAFLRKGGGQKEYDERRYLLSINIRLFRIEAIRVLM